MWSTLVLTSSRHRQSRLIAQCQASPPCDFKFGLVPFFLFIFSPLTSWYIIPLSVESTPRPVGVLCCYCIRPHVITKIRSKSGDCVKSMAALRHLLSTVDGQLVNCQLSNANRQSSPSIVGANSRREAHVVIFFSDFRVRQRKAEKSNSVA